MSLYIRFYTTSGLDSFFFYRQWNHLTYVKHVLHFVLSQEIYFLCGTETFSSQTVVSLQDCGNCQTLINVYDQHVYNISYDSSLCDKRFLADCWQ